MGKTNATKISSNEFKVTTSKNPLINNQMVTSIKNFTNYA